MSNNPRGKFGANSYNDLVSYIRNVKNFRKGRGFGLNSYGDPTYLSFVLLFDFYTINSPLLNYNSENNKTATGELDDYNALKFLQDIGQGATITESDNVMPENPTRGDYLVLFIKTLKRINLEIPWIWQEIIGMDKAWSYNFNDSINIKPDDAKIEIKCLETVELLITGLIEMYRNACFDQVNMREVIPENLRRFSMYIWVGDVRRFNIKPKGVTTGIEALDSARNKEGFKTEDGTNENAAYVMYKFKGCEWDYNSGAETFNNLTSYKNESPMPSISFNYKYREIYSRNYIMSMFESDDKFDIFNFSSEQLVDKAYQISRSVVNSGTNRVINRAQSELLQLLKGNVYDGLRIDDFDGNFRPVRGTNGFSEQAFRNLLRGAGASGLVQ